MWYRHSLNRYDYLRKWFWKIYCPNTDKFFDNMISFPFHNWMKDKELTI